MESREWAGYRGGLYDHLSRVRPIIQTLRFECLAASRADTHWDRESFNQKLIPLVGITDEYMHEVYAAFKFQNMIAPMWDIDSASPVGGNRLRIEFVDVSGRGRERFVCRFVSHHLPSLMVYASLSLRLIDLNTYLDEISTLFEMSS